MLVDILLKFASLKIKYPFPPFPVLVSPGIPIKAYVRTSHSILPVSKFSIVFSHHLNFQLNISLVFWVIFSDLFVFSL